MKKITLLFTLVLLNITTIMAQKSIYDITVLDRKGNEVSLAD